MFPWQTDLFTDLIEKVRRSLVVVQNGHHGAGAGIVLDAGWVLTNNHVAQSAAPELTLPNNRVVRASVVARDAEVDLALLQADVQGTPSLTLGDSARLRPGEIVLAAGHPLGQRNVVTLGVVSSLELAKTNGARRQIQIIRSDVVLLPGNSGGPLVNVAGEVIGINALVVGGDQGYAIPSNLAMEFVGQYEARDVV